ncbi:hypothetical protein [Methylovorus mays]|uniref:hypothetical protein n=1 Tax=Methylovorus mays TaxID=184077 RepID=UPI001E4D7BEB|nr:hypothetical protein [Methylovorus mays]MCB5206723.1 hypothetical protein [Methylovorus mays]
MLRLPTKRGDQGKRLLPTFGGSLRAVISNHREIIKERLEQNSWMMPYLVVFMIGISILGLSAFMQQSNISLLIQGLGICLVGFSLAFLATDVRLPVFDLDALITGHYQRIISAAVMHLSQVFLFVMNLPARLFDLFSNSTVLLRFSIPLGVLKPIPSLPLSFRS